MTRLSPLRLVLFVLNVSSKGLFKRSQGDNGDPPFPRISLVIGSDKVVYLEPKSECILHVEGLA
jgi:hypothetical protein